MNRTCDLDSRGNTSDDLCSLRQQKKKICSYVNNVSLYGISALALMAATPRQAATSGVFLSRFHFGPLSKKTRVT